MKSEKAKPKNSVKAFLARPFVLPGLLFVVLAGCVLFVVSSWDLSGGSQKAAPASHDEASPASGAGSAPKPVGATPGKTVKMVAESPGNPVDARLSGVTVTPIPTSSDDEAGLSPEEKRVRHVLAAARKPFRSMVQALSSFVCRGEMKIRVPNMATSEAAYAAGQHYGEGIEVTSSFTFTKGEDGSFSVHQATRSSTGKTEYDTSQYNGDLYYDGKTFTYIGADGKKADQAMLAKVLGTDNPDGYEPLVHRNWMRILSDITPVVGLDQGSASSGSTTYGIKGANPETQKHTMELSNLEGSMSFLDSSQTLTQARLNGAGTLRSGYMSGANVEYGVTISTSDIGSVATAARAPR